MRGAASNWLWHPLNYNKPDPRHQIPDTAGHWDHSTVGPRPGGGYMYIHIDVDMDIDVDIDMYMHVYLYIERDTDI